LRRIWPDAQFFGCTGPRMRRAGVETVVDAASLAVVGLVEVVSHIPADLRRIPQAAGRRPPPPAGTRHPDGFPRFPPAPGPQAAPPGRPRVYLVAPQVWAWRKGRLPGMRRTLRHVLCIFPFEEEFFRGHGLQATYIGHPLAGLVKPSLSRAEFFRKHRLPPGRPLITVLPGSRRGEAARHLPPLLDAVGRLYRDQAASFILPASATAGAAFFGNGSAGLPSRSSTGKTGMPSRMPTWPWRPAER
jgi:lipid-A-disaccharide synthase